MMEKPTNDVDPAEGSMEDFSKEDLKKIEKICKK